MATKPYKKNAWSFRPNLACNPSPTSFDPQNPPPPPSSLSSSSSSNLTSSKLASSFSTSPSSRKPSHYSSPPKPRRHIFQTIEENREEHALQYDFFTLLSLLLICFYCFFLLRAMQSGAGVQKRTPAIFFEKF